MIISKNTDCSRILLEGELISYLFGEPNPSPYTNIQVTIYYNCCYCDNYQFSITRTVPDAFPTSEANVFNYNSTTNQLEINPALVAASNITWADGIYKIVITATNEAGDVSVSESNCFFVDCSTSCKVAKHIKKLLKEKPDTTLYLLHFGLVNGSNCNCNCEELCYLYRKLIGLLDSTTAVTTCGCSQ